MAVIAATLASGKKSREEAMAEQENRAQYYNLIGWLTEYVSTADNTNLHIHKHTSTNLARHLSALCVDLMCAVQIRGGAGEHSHGTRVAAVRLRGGL